MTVSTDISKGIQKLKSAIKNSPDHSLSISYTELLSKYFFRNKASVEELDYVQKALARSKPQILSIIKSRKKQDWKWDNVWPGEVITFFSEKSSSGSDDSNGGDSTNLGVSLFKEGSAIFEYAGTVEVAQGNNPRNLYSHQREAVHNLDQLNAKQAIKPFAGLLVIPTGGGKTLTAVYWLLKSYVDPGKKILWIAHRHELLEQACSTFKNNAYSNLLKNRKDFKYRMVSGIHDRPVNIQSDDDILIASKDSIGAGNGMQYLLSNWLKGYDGELMLVIDEAHHSTARTYRNLIDTIRKNVASLNLLGLTATPFRTAEDEQGLLSKVFPQGRVCDFDLRSLIRQGILSEPVFEELATQVNLLEDLSDNDINKLAKFDFDLNLLGEATAKTIAENKLRNNKIVSHYLENQQKFGQTLVFALNVDNAIALNALFRSKNIASDYVVASVRDAVTRVNVSPKENKSKIEQFRRGELKVLINVNILTEGTDLPNVETVFLTKPTISSILMTQMIGRGLRGTKAGGTAKTHIVSFIDEWKDKIAWVNPEQIFIEGNINLREKDKETQRRILRLVSIEKIEEFARMLDHNVDTSELENIEFIQRIPVGFYFFSYINPENSIEKNCEALVYDNVQEAYAQFIYDLPNLFQKRQLLVKDFLSENELSRLVKEMDLNYFQGIEKQPGYREQDVRDILQYYAITEEIPQFIHFEEREKFDLTRLAKEILEKDFRQSERREFIDKQWNENQNSWKAFFNFQERYFKHEVDLAIRRLENPELFSNHQPQPQDIKERRKYEKLDMAQLLEANPNLHRYLRDNVYAKAKDSGGYYTCAVSGFKSKNHRLFQIDHVIPISKGGLTNIDNLQLLSIGANAKKSNKL